MAKVKQPKMVIEGEDFVEFTHQELPIRFKIPKVITVSHQIAYWAALALESPNHLIQNWNAAKPLIREWECEFFPDALEDGDEAPDFDELTDKRIARAVMWSGSRVVEWMNKLDEVPKN